MRTDATQVIPYPQVILPSERRISVVSGDLLQPRLHRLELLHCQRGAE